MVQRSVRDRVLGQPLVDACAPNGEAPRQISLQTLRAQAAETGNARVAQNPQNGAPRSQSH
ncbi:MAG: hypothetical protein ABI282_00480 [Candidatus Baltobacteraceae bacterium]